MSKKEPKIAIIIIDSETDEHGKYIPCIIKEGETGYFLTDWTWGDNKEIAVKLANDYNSKLGISKKEINELIFESMFARKRNPNRSIIKGLGDNPCQT